VAADDLSSITGMEDKHRKALERRQITTLRGLASADQHVIYRAMGSIRPRPTLDQIAHWQDEARSGLGGARGGDQAQDRTDDTRGGPDEGQGRPEEAAARATEWHPVASFAVVFAQRRVGDAWERRIEVERTEVEPEHEPEIWPDWECNPICGWMLGQLGRPDSAAPGHPDQAGDSQAQRAAAWPPRPPAARGTHRARRPQLRIDSAAITGAARRADLVTGGVLVAAPPATLVAPARVVFTVSGARPGTEVQAVARLRGHGEPGRNVADLVAVPPSGRVEFDLPEVTAGQLEMTLLAWAPDGTARPVSVSLPATRVSPGPALTN
jgi:hypothetical protein